MTIKDFNYLVLFFIYYKKVWFYNLNIVNWNSIFNEYALYYLNNKYNLVNININI